MKGWETSTECVDDGSCFTGVLVDAPLAKPISLWQLVLAEPVAPDVHCDVASWKVRVGGGCNGKSEPRVEKKRGKWKKTPNNNKREPCLNDQQISTAPLLAVVTQPAWLDTSVA